MAHAHVFIYSERQTYKCLSFWAVTNNRKSNIKADLITKAKRRDTLACPHAHTLSGAPNKKEKKKKIVQPTTISVFVSTRMEQITHTIVEMFVAKIIINISHRTSNTHCNVSFLITTTQFFEVSFECVFICAIRQLTSSLFLFWYHIDTIFKNLVDARRIRTSYVDTRRTHSCHCWIV